jgi:hypothetical protein
MPIWVGDIYQNGIPASVGFWLADPLFSDQAGKSPICELKKHIMALDTWLFLHNIFFRSYNDTMGVRSIRMLNTSSLPSAKSI